MPVKEPNVIRIVNHSSLASISSLTGHLLKGEKLSEEGSIWEISNKYYSARVQLTLEDPSSPPGGVILYFDGSKPLFEDMEFLKGFEDSEVKILLTEDASRSLSSSVLKAIPSLEWELVDLAEEEENDNNDSPLCGQVGLKRVAEALQTVAWEPPSSESPPAAGDDKEEEELENFERLFAQFASLKSHAETLSGLERKKYTEKVVKSFWRALGGDEAEIEGLSSDEEHN